MCDSGCADVLLMIVKREATFWKARGQGRTAKEGLDGKPREDKRVVNAALMAMSNLVNDFSPVKPV